jgi:hypothetical protein
MRKILLLITLVSFCLTAWSQTQAEFEKFVKLFDLYDYPHVMSTDFKKMTKVNTGAGIIDEKLLKMFVYDQGIKPVALYCNPEDFRSYESYIQFPSTDSVFLLTLCPEMRDPACREGFLLATYSKYNYQLQDTLWIYLEGALESQYIDEQQVVCHLNIESMLTEDSICVTRTESHYLRFNNVPRKQKQSKNIKETVYNTTYKMTVGGKFIVMKDEKKDEILDPDGNRLKETPRIVR